jgi:hypothetical protein
MSGENNLSFIETSALDASNVELAFQNILTGTFNSPYMQDTWQRARVAGALLRKTLLFVLDMRSHRHLR